jgi:hypothetical protein
LVQGIFGGACIGEHTVFIFDRGGVARYAQLLDVSNVVWGRDRDGVSEATVRIEGSACSAQASVLSNIEPMRSELVIFRGEDRVWEGPVWRISWHSTYVEINAHDVMAYLFATPLSIAYDNSFPNNDLVTDRIKAILDHELPVWEALSPPANILPHVVYHHFPNEAGTSAVTKPYEMTVGDHIAYLAHYSGIDYTVVGRAIHFWDVSRNLGVTRTLTEADFFSEVVITAYGADLSTRAIVIGSDGLYGSASSPSPYYGPWTTIHTSIVEGGADTATEADLVSQAKRALSGRNPVPVEVRVPDGSGIRLNETLTINDLVPGVQIPLLATLNARTMSQLQKLDLVSVTETPEGETVQVTLTPATKPDDDVESP